MWQSPLSRTRSGGRPPPRRSRSRCRATAANDILILEYTHRAHGRCDARRHVIHRRLTWTEKHDQLYATSTFSGKTLWSRCTGNHTGQTVTGSGLTDSCAAIITQYRGALDGQRSARRRDDRRRAERLGQRDAGRRSRPRCRARGSCWWWSNSPDLAVTLQACTCPGVLPARAERLSTGGTDASIAHASLEMATAGRDGRLHLGADQRGLGLVGVCDSPGGVCAGGAAAGGDGAARPGRAGDAWLNVASRRRVFARSASGRSAIRSAA